MTLRGTFVLDFHYIFTSDFTGGHGGAGRREFHNKLRF